MSEVYVECMVKREGSSLMKLVKMVLIMITVVFAVLGLMRFAYGIPLFIAVLTGVGAYFAGIYAEVEYEYLYLDKELTVDKIYGKTSRKRVAAYEMERVEIIAGIKSYKLDDYKNRTVKTFDYSEGDKVQPDKRYVMYYEGNRKIIFSPNEAMLKALYNAAPRKVFIDR